ncbi:MAG: GFA family protein [Leptospiraceae bacterium]|nr:GFA family protein [Leptospiraceae bacterium]
MARELEEDNMAEEHYKGGCQCGAVKYEVDVDIDQSITCNCSRCQPLGMVLAFTPRTKFHLHSGSDALTEFRFNKKSIEHLFCKICGVESFAYGQLPDGTQMAAINVNCLEDVDPRALQTQHMDGRSA